MPAIPATQEAEAGEWQVQGQPRQSLRDLFSNTKYKAGKVAQAAEHLPSTCEALSSNPSTTRKKKKLGAWLK
jgi:hypothetical protein